MGNAASVEGPGRPRRTTHKLSKPQTVNSATAGLSSPNGLADPRQRYSTTRTMSLPYGASPAPSSMFPRFNAEVQEDDAQPRSRSISRSASDLFRSKSSQAQRTRQRKDSVGMLTPTASTRPSRANSMIAGTSENYYAPSNAPGVSYSWQAAGSRISVNYNMTSYEAKRLLNLTEEPSYEDNSVLSESQFQAVEAASESLSSQPLTNKGPTTTVIPRASSDVSLYMPMRRRSLLTPGVATRIPDIPPVPRRSNARFSLPSTPARRDSLESMGVGMLSFAPLSIKVDSVPNVVTPCETDYRQTGAFKLGSLRITNGSPVRSPAVDYTHSTKGNKQQPLSEPEVERDYFHQSQVAQRLLDEAARPNVVKDELKADGENVQLKPLPPSSENRDSGRIATASEGATLAITARSPEYLPEILFSSLAFESPDTDVSGLQTTSKHTALEDDLFEDEQEYLDPEVLDVRVDLNAKSLPPRPRLISEGRSPRAMTRSDSGVVASPISEYVHKPLAKTDSGYSSNVSLRSFSAKPPVPEKDRPWVTEIEVPPSTSPKDAFPTELTTLSNLRAVTSEDANLRSEHDTPRPPVPQKDSVASHARLPKDRSPPIRSNLGFVESTSPRKMTSLPSPIKDAHSQAGETHGAPERSPLSPTSSSTSTSTLSIASGNRKPGKLQRLLSGAHIPLTVHVTHPFDKNGIPPVPQAAQAKLSEHTNRFPLALKRLALKSELSKGTVRTIFSAGSAELVQEDVPPVPSLPKIVAIATEDADEYHGITLAPHSQAATAIISTRKPVMRKPVPRQRSTRETKQEMDADRANTKALTLSLELAQKGAGEIILDAAVSVNANERETYHVPTKTAHTADTMTAQVIGDSKMHRSATTWSDSVSSDSPSASLLEPITDRTQIKKARTPPPVSMRTRNIGSRQAPPPLRAQSTPPGANRPHGANTLSRKTSRESIHSYPAAVDPRTQPPLSRRSSRENVQSYPPAQEHYQSYEQHTMVSPPGPGNLRKSLSFTTETGEHRRPNWEVQTDHDNSSRRPSIDQGRRGSVASQGDQRNEGMQRSMPRPHLPNSGLQQLRHRASYHGHYDANGDQLVEEVYQSLYKDNGPYPSMSDTNGQAYVTDPWSGRPLPQQSDEQARYPPHVPRGHTRNRSVGSHGLSAPYRVLHSYNSPAYRNVPIWG
ncbi:hypothetical protein BJ170DRAFT_598009 [Xylariales sp. AK1849]|nr:hypothetical protein BJ170DRAFT_598009 [Xylariales sp. AK1849]